MLHVKKTDVVGNAACQQHIVLQHCTYAAAHIGKTQLAHRYAAIQDLALLRYAQAQQHFQQSALTATAETDDGQVLTRYDAQISVFEYPRLAIAIPKAHAAQLDARRQMAQGIVGNIVHLRRAEHDVAQALGVQAEHADFDCVIDERRHPRGELTFVADKRKQHADGERRCHPRCAGAGLQDHLAAQPKHQKVFYAKDKSVGAGKSNIQFGGAYIAVLHFDQQVLPTRAALLFAAQELERADGAQGV